MIERTVVYHMLPLTHDLSHENAWQLFQWFTQGVEPIISFNYGAKKYDRMNKVIKLSMRITLGTTLAHYALVFLFPQQFAGVFTSQVELTELVTKILPIFMGGMWLFGI